MDRGRSNAEGVMRALDATAAAGHGEATATGQVDHDADVLAAIAAGDRRRALELLIDRHGEAIYRFIWAMVRDDSTAEDVHQQVFTQAYQGLDRFGQRSAIVGWLFGIARHRALDELRRRRRRDQRHADELPDVLDPAANPERTLANREVVAALEDCLARLAPAARSAVLLHYGEGLTYVAVGELSRERGGTIQQRVLRALQTLRTCVEARTRARL